jgi:hypothetical protein
MDIREDRQRGKQHGSKGNEAQVKGLLEALLQNYGRRIVEEALGELPAPPPEELETNPQEAKEFLLSYHKAFGPVFWPVVGQLGLHPKKTAGTEQTYGLFLQLEDNKDFFGIEVKGQSTVTRAGKELEIKMIDSGSVKLFPKGTERALELVDVRPGDTIIHSPDNVITIKNLSPVPSRATEPLVIPA